MTHNTNTSDLPLLFPLRRAVALAACGLLAVPLTGVAAESSSPWRPSTAFVQAGFAEHANAAVVGATWDWSWKKSTDWGLVTGYWELSFGRWASHVGETSSHAWVTQLGITPVFRLHPGRADSPWYVEGGIGANVLLPLYRREDKRFSTTFNFGDHLAVGRTFGDRGEHDVALRVQHFSNAGIKHPNPGENFLQLRYSRRF